MVLFESMNLGDYGGRIPVILRNGYKNFLSRYKKHYSELAQMLDNSSNVAEYDRPKEEDLERVPVDELSHPWWVTDPSMASVRENVLATMKDKKEEAESVRCNSIWPLHPY